MKKIVFVFILLSFYCYSQSRKEQIETLKIRLDSLNNVLNLERKKGYEEYLIFESYKEDSENQILVLEKTIDSLNAKLEINSKNLFEKNQIITILETKLKTQTDSLKLFRDQINKLVVNYYAETINLVNKPSFAIDEDYLIQLVTNLMKNACPEQDISGNTGPNICSKDISGLQYYTLGNKFRLLGCVGYSFDGSHADSGSNGFILMEYQNNSWKTIDFMEYQEIDGMQWGQALKLKNPTILGKQAFCFFNEFGYTAAGSGPFHFLNLFGVNKDKIVHFFLGECGAESYEGENYSTKFKIIPSENELFDIDKLTNFDNKPPKTERLIYNHLNHNYYLK